MSDPIGCLPVPSIPYVTEFLQSGRKAPCRVWNASSANSCGSRVGKSIHLIVAVVGSILAHIALIVIAITALPFRCCLKSHVTPPKASTAREKLHEMNRKMLGDVFHMCRPERKAYTIFLAMKSEIVDGSGQKMNYGVISFHVSPDGRCDVIGNSTQMKIYAQNVNHTKIYNPIIDGFFLDIPPCNPPASKKLLEYLIIYPDNSYPFKEGHLSIDVGGSEEAVTSEFSPRSMPKKSVEEENLPRYLAGNGYDDIMPELNRLKEVAAKLHALPAPAARAAPARSVPVARAAPAPVVPVAPVLSVPASSRPSRPENTERKNA